MRVTGQQMHRLNLTSMQQNATNYGQVMQQMSTGKRINVASDDPLGAVQTLSLQREQAAISQYMDNIGGLRMSLSRSESNLDNMNNVMLRMRDLTLQAFNGTNGPEERDGIAAELRILRDSLVDYANAKDEKGKYIYAGHEVDTPPITIDDDGNYVYQGDDGLREIPVGDGSFVTGNDTANQLFFNGATDIFNQMTQWIDALEDPELDTNDPEFHALFEQTMEIIDFSISSVGQTMTEIGGRQNAMNLMEMAHQDIGLFNQELIGNIEDLDYAEASLELATYLLALQATQQSYAQINQMSLFNHI
ncbi:flagellar hook-associated protein FlgL [Ferrimonas pelagia]|uniref:Flagellar hook-associated protein FlgL n=1 Tax=Ferrimonas pelagia TaxID=1177826 RepID=A0ABP9EXC3_9GAMM